jgi:hypothetical protein
MSCCYVDVLLPGVVVETRMGIGNGDRVTPGQR